MKGDLKRYRTFIGSACKALDAVLIKNYGNPYKIERMYSYDSSIPITVIYTFDLKSKAIEDGNTNIVIGWDLSKCKVSAEPASTLCVNNIVYYLSAVLSKHKDAEYYKGLGAGSESKAIEEFKKSEYWKPIQDMLDEFNNGRVEFTLADGEFPRQPDRHLLPIITLDFDKNNVMYYNRRRIYSYKEGRNNYSLIEARGRKGGFNGFIDNFIDARCIPISLVEVRNCPKALLGNTGTVHL